MLLDSRCTQSILPHTLYTHYEKHPPHPVAPLRFVTGAGVLADGTQIPFLGFTILEFKIGSTYYSHEFIVADLPDYPLVGLDFFEQFHCRLDFSRAQLYHGTEVTECCDASGQAYRLNVQVVRRVELPSGAKNCCRLS